MITGKETLFGYSLENCTYMRSADTPRYVFESAEGAPAFAVDDPTVFKNVLMLGGAGSGKTNVLNQVVAQTALWRGGEDGVSLIFDTKGDYLSHPGFYRPGDYVIANGRAHRDRSDIWNLFDEVLADGEDPQDFEANAREIAAVYFRDRGSKTQPFFAHAARDVLAAAIIYFVRRSLDGPSEWKDARNNAGLANFLLSNDVAKLMEYLGRYADFRGLRSYVGDGTSNQALGVMGELRSLLYECFQGNFAARAKPGRRYFSMRRAIREKGGRRIFVLYDLSLGETLSPVYRVLVDLAFKEALGNAVEATGRTHVFLDELKLVPRLQHLEDALNFGRSKRVSVVAGLQSVGQINAAYGEHVGRNILSGFGSVFAFRMNDAASRTYVSDLFGPNVESYRYQNVGNKQFDREREGRTVEQWDTMSLRVGEAVVGLASQAAPFRFRFMKDRDA
ncbi:type IV secretory system conjugative DNA transfer family protein [uncultured Slackia sp.]|uniref:type IV secretory system conjugative DNA transfer family protein n=1 Tax=uncultured Slackia sp. TaxID=665903 RepID=UPI0025E6963E|nr:type IV secretion system DNA-binding domain-containing protein [uncultured Slackia sp.]